jgi:hypothetical protein
LIFCSLPAGALVSRRRPGRPFLLEYTERVWNDTSTRT